MRLSWSDEYESVVPEEVGVTTERYQAARRRLEEEANSRLAQRASRLAVIHDQSYVRNIMSEGWGAGLGRGDTNTVTSGIHERPRISAVWRMRGRGGQVGITSLFVVAALVAALAGSAPRATAATRHASTPSVGPPLQMIASPYTTVSYNPFNPNFVFWGNPNSLLPLGAVLGVSPPVVKPVLATWTTGAHRLVFHLPKKATWQNGTPVTSSDVVTSLLLNGEEINGEWASISGVKAAGAHTVIVNLQPWAVPENVLIDVAGTVVVPESVYGRFLAPNAESDILTYWRLYDSLHPTSASMSTASASPAYKALSAISPNLTKFDPPNLLGDGPYKLVHATFSGLDYVRWPAFYEASRIHVGGILVTPMNSSEVYGALISRRTDLDESYSYTDPQVEKLNRTSDVHYIYLYAPMVNKALIFHETDYPFNLVGVRQALAYLINRKPAVGVMSGGNLLQDPPVVKPTGLPHPMAETYLSRKQYDSLNSYAYNPAKATAILKGLGFAKRSGKWYTPKGQPFAFTLYFPSSYANELTMGLHLAKVFTNFGIPVKASAVNEASYWTEQADGKYPVSEGWANWANPTPLAHFDAIFASLNYPLYYKGIGACTGCTSELAMKPIQTVPGLGKIDIETTLNTEENEAAPSQWRQLTWDWARFFNQTLPDIPLYTNSYHDVYVTTKYTDWPKGSSPWWTDSPVAYFELAGYLRPRP